MVSGGKVRFHYVIIYTWEFTVQLCDVICICYHQELMELAQRKFLRQISLYSDAMESSPYPRLLVLDYLRNAEREALIKQQKQMEKEKEEKERYEEEKEEAERLVGEYLENQRTKYSEGSGKQNKDANQGSAEKEENTDVSNTQNNEKRDDEAASKKDLESKEPKQEHPNVRPMTASGRPARMLSRRKTSQKMEVPRDLLSEMQEVEKAFQSRGKNEFCIRMLCEHEEVSINPDCKMH